MEIRKQIHQLKGSLTLLEVFFSSLDGKGTPDEVFSHVKRYSVPCRNAIKEMERIADALSGNGGEEQ